MSLSRSVRTVAAESGINERTLWRYLSGQIPKNIPRLRELCEVLDCHPSELLTPEWRTLYEGLLIDIQTFVFDNEDDFSEKSHELRGWSRELRNWQKFFAGGGANAIDETEEQPEQIEADHMPLFRALMDKIGK